MSHAHEEDVTAALRHAPGRGSQVSPAERLDIQRTYLSEHGATISGLAAQFGRTRETIAACLKGEDFDRLKARVQSEVAEEAMAVLRRNAVRAAEKWAGEALEIAASKGDHKPARDLLVAAKMIDTDSDGPAITIRFGVNIVGQPE